MYMVYDKKTLQVYHKLTKQGEEAYRELLEKEADKILFKHQHPFLNFLEILKDIFGSDKFEESQSTHH